MGEIKQCEIDIFNKIKSEISIIFDVGAYTDIDYHMLHPTADIHMFEPMKTPFHKLVELIGNKKNVFINNVGCYNENIENVIMYKNTSSITLRNHDIKSDINDIEYINMIRLDWYIEFNNISNFDFIKIDVEGDEYFVLEGLGIYLDKFKFIQLEYGGTYKDVKFKNRNLMLKDIFEKLPNFKSVKLEGMHFYDSYNSTLEDYYGCNYMFYSPKYEFMLK